MADALSRVGHLYHIQAISIAQPLWIQEVINSYEVDTKAQELLLQLSVTDSNEHGYSLKKGIIRYHGRIWVGSNTGLQTKLIQAFHTSPIGGHSGIQSTYHRVKKLFSWAGLKQAVQDFVKQCTVC